MGYQDDDATLALPPGNRAIRSSRDPAQQPNASSSLIEPEIIPEAPRKRGRPRKDTARMAPQKTDPPRKRGRPPKQKGNDDDLVVIESASTPATSKGKGKAIHQELPPKKKKLNSKDSGELPEKRMKLWRKKPPAAVSQRIDRCLTQRMFVLDRQRIMDGDVPEEIDQIAGSTGNVYTVHIKRVPTCDCPDSSGTCKHILYVLMKVLKARDDLVYQAALLSSELREIFDSALPIHASNDNASGAGSRKPLGHDDCPICYCGFGESSTEDVVYCRTQCGTNIHKSCFSQWAATKGTGNVTCVMCRQPWQGEHDPHEALSKGTVNEEGYLNVASELGMSGYRDTSTYYHPPYYNYGGYGFRSYW